MNRFGLLIVLGCLGWLAPGQAAALQVDGGAHFILPQAEQTVDVYVSGQGEIAAFELAVQIHDGQSGPRISSIDLESGIFAANHTGQEDIGSADRMAFYSISIVPDSDPLDGNGLLLRLTLDASGVPQGTYALHLTDIDVEGFATMDSLFLDLDAEPIPTSFLTGTINVVPEPASVTVFTSALAMLLLRRRSRLSRAT